jgi:general secretion pathway protein J
MNHQTTNKGFTLIEVIIALAVFAIIASITSYVLLQSFRTDDHLKAQSERLRRLAFAVTWMRRDSQHMINRPVRDDQQRKISAFVGQSQYVEWTRSGFINPDAKEQRSTLKRVAYSCQHNALVRRTWATLDTTNRQKYHDSVLLSHLKSCSFTYVNALHQQVAFWVEPTSPKAAKFVLPLSIECHIVIVPGGAFSITLPLPIGFYA